MESSVRGQCLENYSIFLEGRDDGSESENCGCFLVSYSNLTEEILNEFVKSQRQKGAK